MACHTSHLGSILVLGSGTTGLAVASHALNLLGSGAATSITLYDSRDAADLPEDVRGELALLEERGLIVRLGEGLACEDAPRYDLCVASPGISMFSDLYKEAAAVSAEVISEPEFAYRLSPSNWIAITGTNGKTTTTALLTHIIATAGGRAAAVGNIGTPTIEGVCQRRAAGADNEEFLVAELSSYQLASVKRFHPRAAILLNVTPDHIDWHRTHEHYRDSKLRMFANMDENDIAVVNIDDPEVRGLLDIGRARVFQVSHSSAVGACGGNVADGNLIVYSEGARHVLCAVEDLGIKGDHNITNALCAACVAVDLGFEDDLIIEALMNFKPIEHRLQFVSTVDGVSYYNDSKATNPDAVLKALTAFGDVSLTLMLGGYDKGTNLKDLVEAASDRCDRVILFGAAAPRFAEAFQDAPVEVLIASALLDALEAARVSAGAGDAVLLSPACASFDEFNSYEHRGEVFIRAVHDMDGDRG